MKKSLFILSALVFVFPTLAVAEEDGIAFYTRECQETFKNSASYCSCALNHFSEQLKLQDERQLPSYEESYKKTKEALRSEPEMTQDKIDAVCALFDKVEEYENLATKSRRDGDYEMKQEHLSKKVEYEQKAKDLAMSYNVSGNNAFSLISGGHCKAVHAISQMKKSLEEYDGGVYLGAREMLKYKTIHVVRSVAMGAGRRAKCQQ